MGFAGIETEDPSPDMENWKMSSVRSEKWFHEVEERVWIEVEERVWIPVLKAHGQGFQSRPEEGDHVYNAFWAGNPKIDAMESAIRSVSERLGGDV